MKKMHKKKKRRKRKKRKKRRKKIKKTQKKKYSKNELFIQDFIKSHKWKILNVKKNPQKFFPRKEMSLKKRNVIENKKTVVN